MGFRTVRLLSVATLLVTPVAGQFGIPMRKKAASFQDLNEQAKRDQEVGAAKKDGGAGAGLGLGDIDLASLEKMFEGVDMSQMQEMWANALNDPETMKQLEGMGDKFGEALEELSKMTPDQLQKQMQEAMSMLTDGDMVDNIVGKKDEVLASLEKTGMVSAEELAKYKADPEYFELKMRESFDQMKGIFNDPDMIKKGMEAMKDGSDEMMAQMAKMFSENLNTDEQIEQARLEILANPEVLNNPMMKPMFEAEEFKDVINDPKKWKESIKAGQQAWAGLSQGAGVGEL